LSAFDTTTTTGDFVATLEVNGGCMVEAIAGQFEALGLDIGGPVSQLDAPIPPADTDSVVTPGRFAIPESLMHDLGSALVEWWDEHAPSAGRPEAVSFRITYDYDDGPAWSTSDAVLHYPGAADDGPAPIDFERTWVAEVLAEISDFEAPQFGEVLRITLPT
jgi:hypothetical protein